MKFTRKSECAMLGIIYLIQQEDGIVSYVGEIARSLDIPQKLLAQVFYRMARKGILNSYRGRGGGFSLALPANEISMRDVIEAVHGEQPLIYHCSAEKSMCDSFTKCSVQEVLRNLQERTMETLESIKLEELARGMVFR